MKPSYVIKRILYTVFIFFIVVTLNFFIPRIGVDDPAERYFPPQGGMSDLEFEIVKQHVRRLYGFDVSTGQQFLNYIRQLMRGDLGTSHQAGFPRVTDLIADRLPWTLVLSVTNMLISVICGIIVGTYAAVKRGRIFDRLLLNASTITTALPAFFIALVLSLYLGFRWEIFPAYTDPNLVSGFTWSWAGIRNVAANSALPIISMSIGGIVGFGISTRNSVISVTNEDFVLTARAKGLSRRDVQHKHILRNGLLPIVTSLGMSVSGLIGGAVVIERIFNWHGMGTLFLNANDNNDYPLMMGIMLFLSSVALLGNLITDLVYGLLDPRTVSEGRR
jgi:peptide/nickel transport system permease protein